MKLKMNLVGMRFVGVKMCVGKQLRAVEFRETKETPHFALILIRRSCHGVITKRRTGVLLHGRCQLPCLA